MVNTARNRLGMLHTGLPFPTGDIDAPTRIEFLARYPGIAFAVSALAVIGIDHRIAWEVRPSPNRVEWALRGRFGPVVARWRFEKQTLGGVFVQDVTEAFVAGEGAIEGNNDRAVFRTAEFSIDLDATDAGGNPITINPLSDYIAAVYRVLVDNEWSEDIPAGLFVLVEPVTTYTPAERRRTFRAYDVGFLLANASTTSTYEVAASTNYVTAAVAACAAANASLRTAFPPTSDVTPNAMSWEVGTPYLRVLTGDGRGLMDGINRYQPWADRVGVVTSRERQDWSTLAPAVVYDGDGVTAEPIEVSAADIRYNQVTVIARSPERSDALWAVATNDDPASPISTVSTGRTFARTIEIDRAVDQATLSAIAEQYLRDEASEFVRGTVTTYPDPRRDAHEVYELDIPGVTDGAEKWRAQSWSLPLEVGAVMTHEVRKTASVAISVEEPE
jgi:hypothetical protein